MIEIKDLLARFEKILTGGEIKKELIVDIVAEITGVIIKKEDLKLQNGVLYLNIKPIYKNEIFIKKEKLLSRLESAFGQKAPKDVR